MINKEYLNNCELCGSQCCRNWNPALYDSTLVDQNGICKYLDVHTNLCTIYDTRPDFCRVYKWYYLKLADRISMEEFLLDQKFGCKALQSIAKRREKSNEDDSGIRSRLGC